MSKKKKKLITHTLMIVDRSGSMGNIQKQAVDFYNEHVQQIQENSKDQDIYCSLITFNQDVFEHFWEKRAEELQESTYEGFNPSGATAFRYAVCYGMQHLEEITDPENAAYNIIVITDGEENASPEFYSAAVYNEITASYKARGNWTISILGASKKALAEMANENAVPQGNRAAFSTATPAAAAMGFHAANSKQNEFYKLRAAGLTASATMYGSSSSCSANFSDSSSADLVGMDMPKAIIANNAVDIFGASKKVVYTDTSSTSNTGV